MSLYLSARYKPLTESSSTAHQFADDQFTKPLGDFSKPESLKGFLEDTSHGYFIRIVLEAQVKVNFNCISHFSSS